MISVCEFSQGGPQWYVVDIIFFRGLLTRFTYMEYQTNDTITKALKLYPAPGTPGSTFASQYERAAAIAGDTVYTCMYVTPAAIGFWHILSARDIYFAESLHKKGPNVFAFA